MLKKMIYHSDVYLHVSPESKPPFGRIHPERKLQVPLPGIFYGGGGVMIFFWENPSYRGRLVDLGFMMIFVGKVPGFSGLASLKLLVSPIVMAWFSGKWRSIWKVTIGDRSIHFWLPWLLRRKCNIFGPENSNGWEDDSFPFGIRPPDRCQSWFWGGFTLLEILFGFWFFELPFKDFGQTLFSGEWHAV